MEEKEAVKMLQHHRHDMMNHLQVIHGYMSMGNTEKAKDKMMSWMHELTEERKLFHLQAPQFALWLMQVNHLHTSLRLSYTIETEANLDVIDEQLTRQCQHVLVSIVEETDQDTLYEGKLVLSENEKNALIDVIITMDGPFVEVKNIEKRLEDMENALSVSVSKQEGGIICAFSIPCYF